MRRETSSSQVLYEIVDLWTSVTDEKDIRNEVERWTKPRKVGFLKQK